MSIEIRQDSTLKPFEFPFTAFHNYILDHIMPDLSPNAWKVLCVAIRQTIGWEDEATESGRKEKDRISYSQFMQMTGIGSSATLSKAIQENLDKGYLLREPSPDHAQSYDYFLNQDYEIKTKTSSETEVVIEETSLETEVVEITTSLETEEDLGKTSSVSKDTKERPKESRGRKKREEKETTAIAADPLSFDLDRHTMATRTQSSDITVPPSAGGADALGDHLCGVFSDCLGIPGPGDTERKMWRRAFWKVLKKKGVTDPALAEDALRAVLDPNNSEFNWYTYTEPTVVKFQRDYGLVLGRLAEKARTADDRRARLEAANAEAQAAFDERYAARPQPVEDCPVGRAVKAKLELQMPRAAFETYVKPSRFAQRDGVLLVTAPDEYTRDWLENRMETTIRRTAVGVCGREMAVELESV